MRATPQIRDGQVLDLDSEVDLLLTQLVFRDHPEWREDENESWSCWLEVQRLCADADRVELLSA